MFGKKPSPPAATAPAKSGCCLACPSALNARKGGMIALTALATFGPKKLRPHVQNFLAVIAIAGLIGQIIKRGKGAKA